MQLLQNTAVKSKVYIALIQWNFSSSILCCFAHFHFFIELTLLYMYNHFKPLSMRHITQLHE